MADPSAGVLQMIQATVAGTVLPKETVPVAVVISGQNYSRYLRDAIESVQQQNPGPKEIVYMDNASTDGSVQIARDMGVRVGVVGPESMNICACRNRGAQITKEKFLIFMDADDVIPKGYVKGLLDKMGDLRVGVTFPTHSSFGLYQSAGRGPSDKAIENKLLARENYIAGQSMVRRVAFEAVGGFSDLPVFQDWEMWLRITEQGWEAKHVPDVVYEHRTHANSLTATFANRMAWYQEVLRRRPLTIFTPFGPGRPITGTRYFDMLENLGLDWDRTTLCFLDNAHDVKTSDMLKGYLRGSPARNTIYLKDDTLVGYRDLESRVQVMPTRMSEMWLRATPKFEGPFVLSIEDDNEPYEPNCAWKLYEGMAPDVDAVSGIYYSRPIVDRNVELALEWHARHDGVQALRHIVRHPGDLPHAPSYGCTEGGATGVGFVLIRKDVLDGFKYPVGRPGNWMGQDFGLWRHVKDRGNRLMFHWGCKTKHFHTADKYT